MIASFKPGMRFDVTTEGHRMELAIRSVHMRQAHARVSARKVFRIVRERYGFSAVDDRIIVDLAKQYGVVKQLLPYAVQFTRGLLEMRVERR